jgi:signal transduction histidine kinase
MSERVIGVGGTVRAEETADGGFLVRAVLPLRSDGTEGAR